MRLRVAFRDAANLWIGCLMIPCLARVVVAESPARDPGVRGITVDGGQPLASWLRLLAHLTS